MSKTLGLSAAEIKGRATIRPAKNGVKRFIALQHLSGLYHFKIGNELFLLSENRPICSFGARLNFPKTGQLEFRFLMTYLRKILSLAFIAFAFGVWVGAEKPKLALDSVG